MKLQRYRSLTSPRAFSIADSFCMPPLISSRSTCNFSSEYSVVKRSIASSCSRRATRKFSSNFWALRIARLLFFGVFLGLHILGYWLNCSRVLHFFNASLCLQISGRSKFFVFSSLVGITSRSFFSSRFATSFVFVNLVSRD